MNEFLIDLIDQEIASLRLERKRLVRHQEYLHTQQLKKRAEYQRLCYFQRLETMINLRNEGKTFKQIGNILGISGQRVSQEIRRGMRRKQRNCSLKV